MHAMQITLMDNHMMGIKIGMVYTIMSRIVSIAQDREMWKEVVQTVTIQSTSSLNRLT